MNVFKVQIYQGTTYLQSTMCFQTPSQMGIERAACFHGFLN